MKFVTLCIKYGNAKLKDKDLKQKITEEVKTITEYELQCNLLDDLLQSFQFEQNSCKQMLLNKVDEIIKTDKYDEEIMNNYGTNKLIGSL